MNQNGQLQQQQSFQVNKKIQFLNKLLQRNRQVQASLKNIKNATKLKIAALQDKIRNDKIYLERPVMKSIIAYLNLMKKIPLVFKEYEFLKNVTMRDAQMINKLTPSSTQRKSLKSIKASVAKSLSFNPKQIDFIELAQIQPQTYKNGLQRYKIWRKQNRKDEHITPFSHNQQILLIEKHNIYRDNWDKICNFFDGRSFQYLYYRFQYYSNKDFKKGRWSLVQNIRLIILVEHFGQKKWAAISRRIKDRSQIQVRERFCNILDPKISKNNWNQQQIRVLLYEAKEYQYEWSKIVQIPLFQGKTDNILWRKFRSLMIQKSESEIKSLVSDKQLANTLIQIKKSRQKRKKINE